MTAAATREQEAADIEAQLAQHTDRGNILSWELTQYEPRQWTVTTRDDVDIELRTTREAAAFLLGLRSADMAADARLRPLITEWDAGAASNSVNAQLARNQAQHPDVHQYGARLYRDHAQALRERLTGGTR